jgi:coenzyme F420-0:L-glutamate ligase/coenzyme F420-1:gamma-L-glutamate ligase
MFGLGSREAVTAALAGADRTAFGSPALRADLSAALVDCGFTLSKKDPGLVVNAPSTDVRLRALLFAFGWKVHEEITSDTATHLAPLS